MSTDKANALAVNRTRGSRMASVNFTTKPLVLSSYSILDLLTHCNFDPIIITGFHFNWFIYLACLSSDLGFLLSLRQAVPPRPARPSRHVRR